MVPAGACAAVLGGRHILQVEISWEGDGLSQADLQQGGVWIALEYFSYPFSKAAGSVEFGTKDLPGHFVP